MIANWPYSSKHVKSVHVYCLLLCGPWHRKFMLITINIINYVPDIKAPDSDAEGNRRTRTLFVKMKISNLFRDKDMESHLIMVNYNNHFYIPF